MKRMDKNMFGISIADYLRKMLLQWKAILLVSLILALAVSALNYSKQMKSYNEISAMTNTEAEENISPEAKIETILSGLSADDRLAVEQLIRQGKWLHERNKYLEESLMMNYDPYNVKTISMSFHISGIENEIQTKGLISEYLSVFDDSDAIAAIGEVVAPGVETRYIKESIMYQIADDDNENPDIEGNFFSVYIVVPEDTNEEDVIQVVKGLIGQKGKELGTKVAGHDIELLSSSAQNMVLSQIIKKKNEIINSITNMQGLHNNSIATSSEVQLGAYSQIMTLMNIAEKADSIDPDAAAETDVIPKPHFSKKYFVLGFALGLVLYLFAALAYILTAGRLTSASSVENDADIRCLGEFALEGEQKSLIKKLLTSGAFANLIYRKASDTAKQMDMLIKKICSICSFRNLKKVTLLDNAGIDEGVYNELITKLSELLNEKEIETEYVRIDSEALDDNLAGIENAILLLSDRSKEKQTEEIIDLNKFYNTNTLGYIFCHEL